MRRSSRIVLGLAVLLLGAAGGMLFVQARPRPTPEALIRQALEDAEQAARRRDVSGVMRIVSDDYKDGVMNKARLRLLLTRYVRQSVGGAYDVRVSPPVIQRDPDDSNRALVLTTIAVSNETSPWGPQEVTLVMRREEGRRWLVFPEDRWRVISVVNLPALPGMGDGGGVFGL